MTCVKTGAGPSRAPRGQRNTRTGLGCLLALCAALSAAAQQPSVLLYGATLDAGRQFAVDSALVRGWRVLSVGAESAVFEQTLEEAEDEQSESPSRVIRVFAWFAPESAGLRVYLRAEEIENPDTDEEWASDVTGAYTDNLIHALSSLRASWDRASPGQALRPESPTAQPRSPDPARASIRTSSARLGTWAYYAERYAQSRGCELADSGAELEAAGQEWEQHLVSCQDGRKLRVHCRYGDCTAAP